MAVFYFDSSFCPFTYFVNYNKKRKEGKNYTPAESFTEFIVNNDLNPLSVREWLLDDIFRKLNNIQESDFSSDLLKLLRSRCFRVVLTTIYDPTIEALMNLVWGKNNYRVMNIFERGNKFDFRRDEALGNEYFDIQPTLYYVFGKADPNNKNIRFVLEDNDVLDCISKWLSENSPKQLMSYVSEKKLMVLGCNLKDWCFRFFWYAMRHKEISKLNNGDIAVLLDEQDEEDKSLIRYLSKTINVRLQTDSRNYIKKLADAIDIAHISNRAELLSNYGGVFISYASEDFSLAWHLYQKLVEAGINVWLDYKKLSVGDEYDKRIEKAINDCKVFIPLLTSTIVNALESSSDRYFRKEWNLAIRENMNIEYFPVTIIGYDKQSSYHQMLPEKFLTNSVFDWSKEPISILIERIINKLN